MKQVNHYESPEQASAPLGRTATSLGDALDKVEYLIGVLRRFRVDIELALEYGNNSHTFDDVAALVISGKLDLYELPNSVILMELTQYPNFRTYHGFVAAGDLQEILDYHPQMNKEAKLRKAKYLSIAGRRGWERAMATYGWQHKLTIMQKEVDYG